MRYRRYNDKNQFRRDERNDGGSVVERGKTQQHMKVIYFHDATDDKLRKR